MSTPTPVKTPRNPAVTREKLVGATLNLMRRQGYTGTTVDQICAEAGLTKGSFFHYFDSKEAVGQVALQAWGNHGAACYAPASANPPSYPLEHIHRLLDIMSGFVEGEENPLVCMVGMLSQEMSGTNPILREECDHQLRVWNEMTREMLAAAKLAQPPRIDFDPAEVAWFLNSLWQGSMLVAKACQDPQIIVKNLRHARAYIDSLFGEPMSVGPQPSQDCTN